MNKTFLIRILLTAMIALPLAAGAARLESVENAYEVPASDIVTVSPNANGTILFAPCEGCAELRAKLSPATIYVVNGEVVSQQDFRPALRKSSGWVYLFVSKSGGVVRKVELDG